MSNPTFKPSEGKREEFRKYLEKNGVMDALTKVLVNLYEEPEKPEDALEYIRDRLAIQAGLETYGQMRTKIDEFQTRIDTLTQEVDEMKVNADNQGHLEEEVVGNPEDLGGEDMPPEEIPVEEIGNEEQAAENPE